MCKEALSIDLHCYKATRSIVLSTKIEWIGMFSSTLVQLLPFEGAGDCLGGPFRLAYPSSQRTTWQIPCASLRAHRYPLHSPSSTSRSNSPFPHNSSSVAIHTCAKSARESDRTWPTKTRKKQRRSQRPRRGYVSLDEALRTTWQLQNRCPASCGLRLLR